MSSDPKRYLVPLTDPPPLSHQIGYDDLAIWRLNLTPQQYAFVREYLIDFNAVRAYAVTYAVVRNITGVTSMANRLLKMPSVQRAIAEMLAIQGKEIALKREAIVARAWEEANNPTSKAADRVKALELTAKLTGNLEDKKKTAPVAPVINVNITGAPPIEHDPPKQLEGIRIPTVEFSVETEE